MNVSSNVNDVEDVNFVVFDAFGGRLVHRRDGSRVSVVVAVFPVMSSAS